MGNDVIVCAERVKFDKTVALLKRSETTQTEFREQFELMKRGLENSDLAFQHNMGMIAAKGQLVKEAENVGSRLLEEGHPGSPTSICAAGFESGPVEAQLVYLDLLERSAATGHFMARSLLWGQRYKSLGVLGVVILIPLRIFLALKIFVSAVRRPNDIRLDRGPKPNKLG